MQASDTSSDRNLLANSITEALQAHKEGRIEDALVKYEKLLPHLNGQLASTLHSNTGLESSL